jgi:hypothetical protein
MMTWSSHLDYFQCCLGGSLQNSLFLNDDLGLKSASQTKSRNSWHNAPLSEASSRTATGPGAASETILAAYFTYAYGDEPDLETIEEKVKAFMKWGVEEKQFTETEPMSRCSVRSTNTGPSSLPTR